MIKKRNLNADLIRDIAVCNVLGVHFFLNSGFYEYPVTGKWMLLMCIIRTFFMTCVPLFLLLTGFLMTSKKLSKQYYAGLWKTYVIYILASIFCIIFKNAILKSHINIYQGILLILAFQGDDYSWYIEMYIGLFLMIPFLNLIYQNLNGKKQKEILLATGIFLTTLPAILNNFNLVDITWWRHPSVSFEYNKLLPNFFVYLYPITYYFIGAYLHEYGWKYSARKTFIFFGVVVCLFGFYNYYRSYEGMFIWGSNCDWMGENSITAVMLFGVLLNIKLDKTLPWVRKIIEKMSQISLGIYLVSWIADQIVYNRFLNAYTVIGWERFRWLPITVVTVLIISTILAILLYLINDLLWKIKKKFN